MTCSDFYLEIVARREDVPLFWNFPVVVWFFGGVCVVGFFFFKFPFSV